MTLVLKRPLVFFDLETTGVNILKDRIVEISYIKLMPDGSEISRTQRFNPGMPIPKEASDVHHITDEDVADAPVFKQFAKSLAQLFQGCDFAGFNSNRFDLPMLDEEFRRANVDFDFSKSRFIDVQTIFHKKEPRNLSAAYRFYCDKNLENAHTAEADTRATFEILQAQLDRYEDLPNDIEKLSDFANQHRNVDLAGRVIRNDKDEEVINFGRYKGKTVDEVFRTDKGYYGWILQGDFTADTKRVFTQLYTRFKQAEKEKKKLEKARNTKFSKL